MRAIRKLPEHVINQIKAGEVVERPVSVVKELLENALDAHAQDVEIELIDGGRQLIRISDNGCGMSREDARMSLERHATSKIIEATDLMELSTFGFRGEALPSIAAVSVFTLRTRRAEDPVGTELHVSDGLCAEPVACGMAQGTEIEVRDLFENLPARKKFLRSTATEFGHIHELLQAMALAYFKVGLRLTHNGREVFHVAPAETLRQRFEDILGGDAHEFIAVEYQKGSFKLEGFVQRPDLARPVPRYFMTFVNGRLVKDRIVRNGVLAGYTGLAMKGVVPACVLFVSVDPHLLDVNAHPNKTEIRFSDPALVQDLVTIALQADLRRTTQNEMLSTLPTAETIVRVPPEARRGDWAPSEMRSAALFAGPRTSADSVSTRSSSYEPGAKMRFESYPSTPGGPARLPGTGRIPESVRVSESGRVSEPVHIADPAGAIESGGLFDDSTQTARASTSSKSPLFNADYLGQFKSCYLLFQAQEDLLVVDQHAFHERILFEELAQQIEGEQGLARQSLLAPLTVPIPPAIADVLKDEEESLQRLGFEIEVLPSARSVALHALPTQVDVSKAASLFDDVIARLLAVRGFLSGDAHPLFQRAHRLSQEWLAENVRPASLSRREIFHLHLATVACHSAVRSGDPLNPELVRRLLLRGMDVDFFAHCPHGRPVWRRWTANDVAQWFSRV